MTRTRAGFKPVALALLTICVMTALPTVVASARHRFLYAGQCVGHPPDVPAHPCAEAEYRAEFATKTRVTNLIFLSTLSGFLGVALGVAVFRLTARLH